MRISDILIPAAAVLVTTFLFSSSAVAEPVPCQDYTDCDDGDPCTEDGCVYIGKFCINWLACSDNDPCTEDLCEASTGACSYPVLDPCPTTTTFPPPPDGCGDPNESGSHTAADAAFTLGASVGVRACAPCICDVTNDGTVTAIDALSLLWFAVGKGVYLECPAC